MKAHDSLLDAVGNTPLLRLQPLDRAHPANIYAKLETANPSGSSKDRVAGAILRAAHANGELAAAASIVVATSGNLGISLVMAAKELGHRCICVVADSASDEKLRIMRAFGARVVVTPADIGENNPASNVSVARQMATELPGSYLVDYRANPANPAAHYDSTGPEIWQQSGGSIRVFVAAIGSGGTLCGVGRYLKEQDDSIRVIGVEPRGSGYASATERATQGRFFHSRLEGVGSGCVSPIYDANVVDEVLQVSDREAISFARRLAREQGILAGGSSGLALAGALHYAEAAALDPAENIVVLFADCGTLYLSTIFDDRWMQESRFLDSDWDEETLDALLGSGIRPALIFAYADETVGDVVAKLSAAGVSQLPVLTRDERLLGLTTEFRLLDYMLREQREGVPQTSLVDAAVIETDVPTLDRTMPLDDVLILFSKHKAAIIMEDDPFRGEPSVVGILTQIDLLDYLAKR